MLDNLLEIEIAYNMLKVGDDSAKDPIDLHYQKLKTDIQVTNYLLCATLSPTSIIWYRTNRRERNASIWERCGLPAM